MESFQIKLSSKEILVLSAMLGFESVFGVDDNIFLDKDIEIKPLIRQTVRRMERKKLIRYDLDGTLFIIPELRKSIECICNAETIGLFSTNLKSGKKVTVYILGKDELIASLQRSTDGKYVIKLSKDVFLNEIIPYEILSAKGNDIKEMMLFEEAECVRKQIEEFNHDNAEKQVQKHSSSASSAKTITRILSGNCGYMSVQIHKKGKALYDALYNNLIVSVDGQNVSVYTDENDVLHFEAIDSERIIELISSNLSIERKRGAV